jgi:hypothetical protein
MLLHFLLPSVQLWVLLRQIFLPVPEVPLQLFFVVKTVFVDLQNALPNFQLGFLLLLRMLGVHVEFLEGLFKLLFLSDFFLFLFFLFLLAFILDVLFFGLREFLLFLRLRIVIVSKIVKREGIFLGGDLRLGLFVVFFLLDWECLFEFFLLEFFLLEQKLGLT